MNERVLATCAFCMETFRALKSAQKERKFEG